MSQRDENMANILPLSWKYVVIKRKHITSDSMDLKGYLFMEKSKENDNDR